MKINGKPFPQWLNWCIAFILIVTIKVVWKHLDNKPADKWKPFQTVAQKASIKLFDDTLERKKWCDCMISTFKKKYPDGYDNASPDTINTQVASVSYDCAREVKHLNK